MCLSSHKKAENASFFVNNLMAKFVSLQQKENLKFKINDFPFFPQELKNLDISPYLWRKEPLRSVSARLAFMVCHFP